MHRIWIPSKQLYLTDKMVKRVLGIEIKIPWRGSLGLDGGNGTATSSAGLAVSVMASTLEILDELLDKVC